MFYAQWRFIYPSDEWKVQPNLSPSVKTVEKTTRTVEKILKILSNTPSITVREMSEILGLLRRGVEEQIKSLKQKGVIRRIGPDKGGHWEVMS